MFMPRSSPDRLFLAVSLGHAVNDFFIGLRSVLLTFISAAFILPMTGGQIGLANSLVELSGALSQPFFGILADKNGGRWIGSLGVLFTASMVLVAMVVATTTGSYWLMVAVLILAGLGNGAFHPVGSMNATSVDTKRAGLYAAVFFMCGQLGLAVGPALVGLLLNNAQTHLNALYAPILGPTFAHLLLEQGSVLPVLNLGIVIVPVVVIMALNIPGRKSHKAAVQVSVPTSAVESLPFVFPWKPFLLLTAAAILRSPASAAVVSFMPLMFQSKGWTPAEYGFLTSLFWVASGFAGVGFGYLGDRYDPRRVVMWSLALAAPGIFLLASLNGVVVFAIAILVGGLSGSHSLVVVLAQRLMPGRRGFASGAVLGLIFASGALGNLVIGSLIDHIGIVSAFHVGAVITLVGSILWLWLPLRQETEVLVERAAAPAVAKAN